MQELAESIRRGISVAEEGGEHGVEEVGTGLDGPNGYTGGEEAGGVSKEEEDAWRHRLGLRPREGVEGLSEEEQAEANEITAKVTTRNSFIWELIDGTAVLPDPHLLFRGAPSMGL